MSLCALGPAEYNTMAFATLETDHCMRLAFLTSQFDFSKTPFQGQIMYFFKFLVKAIQLSFKIIHFLNSYVTY